MAPEPAAVATDRAPAAVGPYSQAIRSGDLLFLSGQIGLDPATGTLVEGGTEAETRQVLRNIDAVLEAAGARRSDLVRMTIYLVDIGEFARVNQIYGDFLEKPYPSRSTVGVAALPKGARVEIDAIARVG